MKNTAEKNQAKNRYKIIELMPIIMTVAIVPLIVFLRILHADEDYYKVWTTQHEFFDFFSYYKMAVLLFFTSFAFIMFARRLILNGMEVQKKNIYYASFFVYAILVVVSTYTSEYQKVAAYGFLDRSEGMVTLLAYCFMCFYSFYVIESLEDVKKVLYGIMFSGAVICVIGVFQYFGMDFFKSNFGKELILPYENHDMVKSLEFKYADYVIYSTLFHYNYVGSYTALIFPIFLVLCIFTFIRIVLEEADKKQSVEVLKTIVLRNIKENLIYILLTLLVGFVLFACGARSALIGLGISFIALAALYLKYFIRNKKLFFKVAVAVFILLSITGILARNVLTIRFNNTVAELKNSSLNSDTVPLKDLKVSDKEVQILTKDKSFKVSLNSQNNLEFSELDGSKLPFTWNKTTGGSIAVTNQAYRDYNIKLMDYNEAKVLVVKKEGIRLYFGVQNSKFFFLNPAGLPMKYEPVESFGFKGMEKLASQRGYIWSRTLPLLKNSLLWGYGPDNFIFYFPQHDVIGKSLAYGDMWMTVDKPHNFYLQQAVNSGVLSLLILMVIFISYFIHSWKLYNNCDFKEKLNVLGIGCLLGVWGYLSAGLFNDSNVSTAPLFWVVLGVGIAINRIVSEKMRESVN